MGGEGEEETKGEKGWGGGVGDLKGDTGLREEGENGLRGDRVFTGPFQLAAFLEPLAAALACTPHRQSMPARDTRVSREATERRDRVRAAAKAHGIYSESSAARNHTGGSAYTTHKHTLSQLSVSSEVLG